MHPCQISPKMLDLWRSLPSKWSNLSSNCLLLLSLYFLLHLLHLYSSSNSSPLTCILSNTPVLSILLATFTEFPQMSYWGLLAPITPAMTGPWFIPAKTEINVRNTKHTFNFLPFVSDLSQYSCTTHSPILSLKLLKECVLINSSLPMRVMAKSTMERTWL